MWRNAYWTLVALVLAIMAHIGTLLFAPGYAFEQELDLLAKDIPTNKFFVLPQEAQLKIFPEYPAGAVFGMCRFDLSSGDVSLNADLPDTLWTLTVYTSAGKSIYTANDEQSGTDKFELKLMRAPSLLELFSAKADEDLITNSGWRVSSSDTRGFALFWVPSFDLAMRANLVETISKSSCAKAAS
jgi:uncharacterized membrane protein